MKHPGVLTLPSFFRLPQSRLLELNIMSTHRDSDKTKSATNDIFPFTRLPIEIVTMITTETISDQKAASSLGRICKTIYHLVLLPVSVSQRKITVQCLNDRSNSV
ncbi:hypothetical protein K439DRAFT_281717 [Ramaria rubella]|nr:hypothetical protein K439DRAFT_281717 [Ramaria rubella]